MAPADDHRAATTADDARRPPIARRPRAAVTVFGASGDLAARKLFPALAALADHGLITEQLRPGR